MPVCCKYKQAGGGTAIGCYNRDECPEIEGMELVDEKAVDECLKSTADCFPDDKDAKAARILTEK